MRTCSIISVVTKNDSIQRLYIKNYVLIIDYNKIDMKSIMIIIIIQQMHYQISPSECLSGLASCHSKVRATLPAYCMCSLVRWTNFILCFNDSEGSKYIFKVCFKFPNFLK